MRLSRLVAVFLSVLILFAECGQVVYAHTCFKSNATSYSLFVPAHCKEEVVKKSCCNHSRKAVQKNQCTLGKKSCCGISSTYVKGNLQSAQADFKMPDVPKDLLFEQPIILSPVAFVANTPVQLFTRAQAPPGNTSLAFICVFRC